MELIGYIVDYVKAQPTLAAGFVALIVLFVWSTKTYLNLSHIPGPFLANFTNVPRFLWVLSYQAHEKHIEQHRKYGPIVRFGPNMVSVGAPSEISTIYRFSKPWPKASFVYYRYLRPLLIETVVRLLPSASYEAEWQAYSGYFRYSRRENPSHAQETGIECLLNDGFAII